MTVGPRWGSSPVNVLDCDEFVVTVGYDLWSRSIPLDNITIGRDAQNNNRLELQERYA
jgi:hypothetical protein